MLFEYRFSIIFLHIRHNFQNLIDNPKILKKICNKRKENRKKENNILRSIYNKHLCNSTDKK